MIPLDSRKKCTLTDDDLIRVCNEWIHKLAISGGEKWTLAIPVDFDRDPDMLFSELITRYKEAKNQRNDVLQEAIDKINNSADTNWVAGCITGEAVEQILKSLKNT